MSKKKLNLSRVLYFPTICYGEAKEFREEHSIRMCELERYTGINARTIQKIEAGYAATPAITNLYLLAIERLMMLDQGYVPTYSKLAENGFPQEA